MIMAFAPQRVQSLPNGSICQAYDIGRSLNEALRKQANLKAQVARMKIDHKQQRLTTRRIIVRNKMKLNRMVALVAQNETKINSASKIKILGSTNTTTSKD